MLPQFLKTNRAELIALCRAKVDKRHVPEADDSPLEFGIPRFLDQLIATLETEYSSEPIRGAKISGRADGIPAASEIAVTAARHGSELFQHGFTVEQVVRDYGDLCQSITGLASEQNVPIPTEEFRTLNRCLDDGIADAVTEYARSRDSLREKNSVNEQYERLGSLAHELRNHINTATLAVRAIKLGAVGLSGATGAILDRSLIALRAIIDRSLAEVRLGAEMPVRRQRLSVAEFIADVKVTASLEAQARGCHLSVGSVDPTLEVDVDRDLLFSAVGNLLQNAFKFSAPRFEVSVTVYAVGNRVFIDVEDSCGGLAAGVADAMFKPFTQSSTDKSGVGLGLSICRRSIEANNGIIRVRDKPGAGCVFTIDLPLCLPDAEARKT